MDGELLEVATEAARAGERALAPYFRSEDLEARWKSRTDVVTAADRAAEAAIVGVIRERFPEHRVLAEEGGLGGGAGEHQWVVDPLDGTSNFLQGLPIWAIAVACRHAGRTVAGVILDPRGGNLFAAAEGRGASWNGRPMRVSDRAGLEGGFVATGYPFRSKRTLELYLDVFRDVFQQVRSLRRCGSAALDLAYTAAGVYDGFFEFRLSPWDIAAGEILVREAGGRITDLDGGDRFLDTGNVIAGGPAAHRELLAAVARHADEAAIDAAEPRPWAAEASC